MKMLIVAGIACAIGLDFLLGVGAGRQWGASQWGPVASWLSSAVTLGAVVIALRQSILAQREARRGELARLIDHEAQRRRECINALAQLWGAITGLQMEFVAWTQYLDELPITFSPNQQRRPARLGQEQTYEQEFRDKLQAFSSKWQNSIEQPLFVALLVLRGTGVFAAVAQLNDTINEIKLQGMDGLRKAGSEGARPDTRQIKALWESIKSSRNVHLALARENFSLRTEDIEVHVLQNWKRSHLP